MPALGSGTPPSPTSQANPPLLHRMLGIGMVILAAVIVILRQTVMSGPIDEGLLFPAYVVMGASALMIATSLMMLKPRVPRRRAGQTRDAYWADVNTARQAMLVWFLLEGSAVLASVAFFLSASPIAAALIVAGVVAFWMNGPGVFETE